MKMMMSQVMQVMWLIDQLINSTNLHMSGNLFKYFHCSFSRIGRKNEIDKIIIGRSMDLLMTLLLRHTIVILLFELPQSVSVPLLSQKCWFSFDFIGKSLELLKILQKSNVMTSS